MAQNGAAAARGRTIDRDDAGGHGIDAQTSDLYLYYALQNMHFISTDVAVPGLNRDFAYSRTLLSPPAQLRARFLEVAGPIHEQIVALSAMSGKLRTARDLLLPRLMSGELTV